MIHARLSQLASVIETQLVTGDAPFRGASTDTRTIEPGMLFVALRGERFDGHEFAQAAKERGAVALLVERELPIDLPQLVCADTLEALGQAARWWREHVPAQVIGITGSNGKTTVKTLTASILSRIGRCHVNTGNLNNEVGLPLTLLKLPADAEFAVLEMGAGKPGDIDYLAQIARPDIGLVNNVAPAHLERMGSIEGVAHTKGAIYTALGHGGTAIINADDAFAGYFAGLCANKRSLRFGLDEPAEVSAKMNGRLDVQTPNGAFALELPLAGRHNVLNALAATAIAIAAGAPLDAIREGLEAAPNVSGRLTRHDLGAGFALIDDAYNANPGAVGAAIDTLALERGARWLVLGNMAEGGPDARALHAQVGARAKQAGLDALFTVGALAEAAAEAFGKGARHFPDKASLAKALLAAPRPALLTVLVKGSRSSAMEEIVNALLNAPGAGHAA